MRLLLGITALAISLVVLNILRIRRRSITGIRKRNRYFMRLAEELKFTAKGDDYLLQLEGNFRDRRAIVYPHNFEGPGSITLIHLLTHVPFTDRTWIEPALGLGRAIVQWKRREPFSLERSGKLPNESELIHRMELLCKNFPFIAITLPSRFLFSQLATESLQYAKDYTVVIALDSGRRPAAGPILKALDAASDLAATLEKAAVQQN